MPHQQCGLGLSSSTTWTVSWQLRRLWCYDRSVSISMWMNKGPRSSEVSWMRSSTMWKRGGRRKPTFSSGCRSPWGKQSNFQDVPNHFQVRYALASPLGHSIWYSSSKCVSITLYKALIVSLGKEEIKCTKSFPELVKILRKAKYKDNIKVVCYNAHFFQNSFMKCLPMPNICLLQETEGKSCPDKK